MGSKAQRQNQHIKRLERKIRQFQAKGQSTEKLEKEFTLAISFIKRVRIVNNINPKEWPKPHKNPFLIASFVLVTEDGAIAAK